MEGLGIPEKVRLETNIKRLLDKARERVDSHVLLHPEDAASESDCVSYFSRITALLSQLEEKTNREATARFRAQVEELEGKLRLSNREAPSSVPGRQGAARTIEKEEQDPDRLELLGTNVSEDAGHARMSIREIQERIMRERRIQEEVTQEMLGMASVLKDNSTRMHDTILKDIVKLEETSEFQSSTISALGIEQERLDDHVQKSLFRTLWVWIMLLVVAVIFMSTFMFLRTTPKF